MKLVSGKLLFFILLCSMGSIFVSFRSHAANQVIHWGNDSTNYNVVFGTNEVTNIVSVSVLYPNIAGNGLKDDGTIVEAGFYNDVPFGPSNAVSIASSTWYVDEVYSLALRSDGKVIGWKNWNGGPTTPPTTLSNVVAISAGLNHAIALKKDGTITGWGYNFAGDLDIPAEAIGVVAISAGAYHNLALKSDGTIVAWGNVTNLPVGLSNIVAVAAGFDHSLALKADGKIIAWGNQAASYNTILAGISNIAVIASGSEDFAIKSNGTIISWGGYSGYTTPTLRLTPPIATNVISIACGYKNMAILGNGLPRTPAYPMKLSAPYGLPLVLPVGPSGARAIGCQWNLNGTNLPDVTNQVLFLDSVDFTNAGIYSVTVSNWYGVVTNSFTINVVPFLITTQPESQTVYGGTTASFNVTASGVNLNFQWRFNGTNLVGETNSTLSLTNVLSNQAGAYSVVVANAYGTNVSSDATLTLFQQTSWFDNSLSSMSSTNGFSLELNGLSAHGPVLIYASSNLIDWAPIFTNPPVIGGIQFEDLSATNQPMRFYRAVEQ